MPKQTKIAIGSAVAFGAGVGMQWLGVSLPGDPTELWHLLALMFLVLPRTRAQPID